MGDLSLEALLKRTRRDRRTGCLRWQGAKNSNGYPRVYVPGRRSPALVTRFVVEITQGPIPDGYVVDHVYARGCRHVDCINPDHLEAVTSSENFIRGSHARAVTARTKVCANNHRIEGDNVKMENGKPRCRRCVNDRKILDDRRHRAAKKAA